MKTKMKKTAYVPQAYCVACGSCIKVCPKGAIAIRNGLYALVDPSLCIGCGLCAKTCPADIIQLKEGISHDA